MVGLMPEQREKPEARRRRHHRDPPSPEKLREFRIQETLEYLADSSLWAHMEDMRAQAGLRIRADGTPSSRQPQSWVPLKYWATVYDVPVVQYTSLGHRLERYRDRLRYLQSRGLYDGPTELTYVNRPKGRTDARPSGVDQGGSESHAAKGQDDPHLP